MRKLTGAIKQTKSGAVSPSVNDAKISPRFGDLPRGFGDRLVPRARRFVFPAGEQRVGEKCAQLRNDLRSGFEGDVDRTRPTGDFRSSERTSIRATDLFDAKICQGSRVKNSGDLPAPCESPKFGEQLFVRSKNRHHIGLRCKLTGGPRALQTDDAKPCAGECFYEENSEFAGGKISQPPHTIDRLVARAAGHDDA